MKKLVFLFAMAVAVAAFGAADDMLISFSTPGIDKYADGTRVKAGESYALIWTKDGATFGGLTDKCVPVADTDKIVMVAPLAKRGRCPLTVVEIAAEESKQYQDGTFSLYLLDTRTKGADGKVKAASYVNGFPQVVNSVGRTDADGSGVQLGERAKNTMYGASAVQLADVGVYTEICNPQITAIKVEGAKIRLEVKDMSEAADYFVVPGATPGNFAPAMNATADKTGFTFDKPKEPATFYKVIGVRKFGSESEK